MSTFISYAQNFEDVLLWRALKDIESGFYIDIGANSPIVDSVSLAFYEHGWTGINVEPSLEFIVDLNKKRSKDTNVHAAVSDEKGLLKFYDIAETGLSTLLIEVAESHSKSGFKVTETIVPAITLDDLLQDSGNREVHWMKIDVEGAEQKVLNGWKACPVRPWIVVVESVLPATHVASQSGWQDALEGKGYRFAYFDGLNRYFVSENHLDLLGAFEVAPNVFDRFSLSGTATSTFCAIVNHRLMEANEKIDEIASNLSLAERERVVANERAAEVSGALTKAYRELIEANESIARISSDLIESERELTESRALRAVVEEEMVERDAKHQEAIEASQATMVEIRGAYALLQESYAFADRENKELRKRMIETLAEYRGLIREKSQAQEALGAQNHQLSLSKAAIVATAAERDSLLAQLRSSAEQVDNLHMALRAVQVRLNDTLGSSSWKVTAPLRFLSAAVRGSGAESSAYFREALRNLSQVRSLRRFVEQMLPENGRLRAYLVARIRSSDAQLPLSPAAPSASQTSSDLVGAERVRLFNKIAVRIRDGHSRRESTQ